MFEIRRAREADLDALFEMIEDFVSTHKAHSHPRSRDRLREAYFGAAPVGTMLVAVRGERVVGMVHWQRMFDLFWSLPGGRAEWLYVRPEARGYGLPAALLAEVCKEIRAAGGVCLTGGGYETPVGRMYERVALAWPSRECSVGLEAFQQLADLAGQPPREIVRRLPSAALNRSSRGELPSNIHVPTPLDR
jgi:GNAT superfamily N-acetyltransferase